MKLLISETQLAALVNHIDEADKEKALLAEGWKEVVLGTAMLLGIGLSGANAQSAKNALNSVEILQQIEQTLEGEKIHKLAQTLEDAGLENALEKMKGNAQTLEDNFNKAAKDKGLTIALDLKGAESTNAIKSKVRQGYAVTGIEIKKDTVLEVGTEVLIQDTINIDLGGNNMFLSGAYELKPEAVAEIQAQIEGIKAAGGKIVKVNIYSSTDKEPMRSMVSANDPTGNVELAQQRVNSMKTAIGEVGVEINVNQSPNMGDDIYSTEMSQQERDSARIQTAEHRFNKITIIAIIPTTAQPDEDTVKVVERIEIQLARTQVYKSGTAKVTGGKSSSSSKFKCLKIKMKGKSLDCPSF